jgi:hypothetical protein
MIWVLDEAIVTSAAVVMVVKVVGLDAGCPKLEVGHAILPAVLKEPAAAPAFVMRAETVALAVVTEAETVELAFVMKVATVIANGNSIVSALEAVN